MSVDPEKAGTAMADDVGKASHNEEHLDAVRQATQNEHDMTLWECICRYKKAVAWSVALSSCLIMEGYDRLLIGSFYGFPAFKRRFGVETADGSYEMVAAWQSGLSNGALAGSIIGLIFSGYLSERFGYRVVISGSLIFLTGVIFLMFFAVNIQMLQAAYILAGPPWGVFQTITTTYAAEVCPVKLRPVLTTYVNMCWVIGQLIASGVLRAFSTEPESNEWAWRIPYAIQWVWPVPILIAVICAPESPWWLVRQGRLDDAAHALARLTTPGPDSETENANTIAMMVYTDKKEQEIIAGTSYMDCFRGVNLRRTEITCAVWSIQNLCGNALMTYSTYFFQQAGLPVSQSFNMTIGQFGIAFVGTISSWFFMGWFGRRTLYCCGLAVLEALLVIIGCIAVSGTSDARSWATGSMLLVFVAVYAVSVGPICYSLVAEMPSSRLRPKTMVLARSCFNFFGIIDGILMPYMLNPTAWNWKGKAGFFWAGINFICLNYCFWRLPEPKGRTYAELDDLFERKVSARKFKQTQVEI